MGNQRVKVGLSGCGKLVPLMNDACFARQRGKSAMCAEQIWQVL